MNRILGGAVVLLVAMLLVGGSLRPQAPAAPPPGALRSAPAVEGTPPPAGQGVPAQEPSPSVIAVGTPAPDFELQDVTGRTVRLSDYRGKVVFLNFWATWCPPCREEMPEIQRLVDKGVPDLVVLGVNTSDPATPAEVKAFMERNGFTWRVPYDAGSRVARIYRVVYLPTSYFIGPDGIVWAKYIGPMSLPVMESYVERARQGG
ncbi:MAG: alkyl hydroperoxide reductase [Bacillota bacterium]|nr:MAG: alkyl hydroperoxide reductase [Bacillota bacterium]